MPLGSARACTALLRARVHAENGGGPRGIAAGRPLAPDENGLAADERRLTQIENPRIIRVHRCSSAADIGSLSAFHYHRCSSAADIGSLSAFHLQAVPKQDYFN